MVKIIIVEKTGDLLSSTIQDMSDIFKRCNFRKEDGFQLRTTWIIDEPYTVQLYCKIEGKPHTVNKYEFPPPVEHDIYYGRCAIVQCKGDELVDMDIDYWVTIQDRLWGGSISSEESEHTTHESTVESELEEEPYDYPK
jgi:hypothetical protein